MEIHCRFNFSLYGLKKFYRCSIDEADITEKENVIKKFKGIHQTGKTHYDVERVSFFNTNVNHFPRGLQIHFPNLTNLIISECGIKEISKNDLKGLERLVRLFVKFCELTSLPDDLLTEMPKLEVVSFGDNKIEFASSEVFKPLLGRQNVGIGLQGNRKIDACFWPGEKDSLKSFDDLMKLIDEMCIKPTPPIINADTVDFNSKLKEMWISGKFSDLTIVAGEKKFKVHKAVLGMNNEVFAKLLEDQSEATEIKIPVFSSTSVEVLLKFIYTNEASEDGNAEENFKIAEKFKVAAMKSFYEKIVLRQVDILKALEAFLFAHRFASQQEKNKAVQQIVIELQENLPNKLNDKMKITGGVWMGIISVFILILIIIEFLRKLIL